MSSKFSQPATLIVLSVTLIELPSFASESGPSRTSAPSLRLSAPPPSTVSPPPPTIKVAPFIVTLPLLSRTPSIRTLAPSGIVHVPSFSTVTSCR